jgi:hypothetical protein
MAATSTQGDVWLGVQQLRVDRLHGFADLDQTNPHGIENEPIAEAPAFEVRCDR